MTCFLVVCGLLLNCIKWSILSILKNSDLEECIEHVQSWWPSIMTSDLCLSFQVVNNCYLFLPKIQITENLFLATLENANLSERERCFKYFLYNRMHIAFNNLFKTFDQLFEINNQKDILNKHIKIVWLL